jgi:hypothetical protein
MLFVVVIFRVCVCSCLSICLYFILYNRAFVQRKTYIPTSPLYIKIHNLILYIFSAILWKDSYSVQRNKYKALIFQYV